MAKLTIVNKELLNSFKVTNLIYNNTTYCDRIQWVISFEGEGKIPLDLELRTLDDVMIKSVEVGSYYVNSFLVNGKDKVSLDYSDKISVEISNVKHGRGIIVVTAFVDRIADSSYNYSCALNGCSNGVIVDYKVDFKVKLNGTYVINEGDNTYNVSFCRTPKNRAFYGGGCPTLEETILISENGDTALVKDIVIGSTIYTKNEKTNEWEYAEVECFKDTLQPVYKYVLDNGVEVEVSESHAFKTDTHEQSYHTYDTMQKLGSKIVDANGEVREIVSREFVGEKIVRSYEIIPSHTYIVKGLLSHNVNDDEGNHSSIYTKEVV